MDFLHKMEKIIKLQNKEHTFITAICICRLNENAFDISRIDFLSREELEYYRGLKNRHNACSFLTGRYAGKCAASQLTGNYNLKEYMIEKGILNQPVFCCEEYKDLQVTISHCNEYAVAIAFSQKLLLGVDIEEISLHKCELIEHALLEQYKEQMEISCEDRMSELIFIWSAQEAVSKCIKTGLTIPGYFFQLQKIEEKQGIFYGQYLHFRQFQSIAVRFKNYILTIAYPSNLSLHSGMEDLSDILSIFNS